MPGIDRQNDRTIKGFEVVNHRVFLLYRKVNKVSAETAEKLKSKHQSSSEAAKALRTLR
jgi:hypothetical protein